MATSVTQSHIFGTKSVTTAGTRVQLDATERPVSAVMIIAKSSNVGRIFYGGSDVASTTQTGLEPGESVVFGSIEEEPFMLTSIYIDSATNSDGVDFVATRARRGPS